MRFCPECGENVENITDKCPKCGFDIAGYLKELERKENERREKDRFLFTEGSYDFANSDRVGEERTLTDVLKAAKCFAGTDFAGINSAELSMMRIIRLKPVFKEMVWGGNRMRAEFGYDIPGDDTGECWAIAAHKHGDCIINGGVYDGKTLSWLWENKPELFGRKNGGEASSDEVFPLLVKIIDAKKDLSIQVHPDDEYARIHERGAKGKTECWYILDCEPGATIIIGHNAKTEEELENMIGDGRWGELLREIPIKKGDFFQIFPGTVHAIKGGTMILETQQNSDVTYRVYDYGRLQNGKPRELHIRQSLDVIKVPFDPDFAYEKGEPITGASNEPLVKCDYYRVWHLNCKENSIYHNNGSSFMLCSVISGEGSISLFQNGSSEHVKKGDHLILLAGFEAFTTTGAFEMICSSPSSDN